MRTVIDPRPVEDRRRDLERLRVELLHDAEVYDKMAAMLDGDDRAGAIYNATLQRARAAMVAKALAVSA